MPVICLHDKRTIELFLRKNIDLHIYELGDLDDFFWPYTTRYALTDNEIPQAIALLYTGLTLPTLLALAEPPTYMANLLKSILPILPAKFYAHFSPGLEKVVQDSFELESFGVHYKMTLKDRSVIKKLDCSQVIRLSKLDQNDMIQLYEESYHSLHSSEHSLDIR